MFITVEVDGKGNVRLLMAATCGGKPEEPIIIEANEDGIEITIEGELVEARIG